MKPILMDFPMPIFTNHLVIRPPMIGDGINLKDIMPLAITKIHSL